MALFNIYTGSNPPEKADKPQKKKIGAMDVALIISCVIMVIFTAVMVWLFIQYNSVPDTLITCVFAVLGGECGVLGWIKTTKCKTAEKADEKNEEAKG